MTDDEVKESLRRYRPGMAGSDEDAEVREALRLAENDPGLKSWLEEHCQRQREIMGALRSIPAPAALPRGFMAEFGRHEMRRPPAARWMAMAAGLVLLLALGFWQWRQSEEELGFENFRSRMVRTALREYRMDIHSSEAEAIRGYLETNGAPSEFGLPPELDRLPRLGGGKLSWNGNPVSMVCFDRGETNAMFLFVVRAAAAEGAPGEREMAIDQINKLHTASWQEGENAFLLASYEPVDAFVRGTDPGF